MTPGLALRYPAGRKKFDAGGRRALGEEPEGFETAIARVDAACEQLVGVLVGDRRGASPDGSMPKWRGVLPPVPCSST